MEKVAIVVESIACLTSELVVQYQIGIVPIRLLIQGKVTGTGTLGFAFYPED